MGVGTSYPLFSGRRKRNIQKKAAESHLRTCFTLDGKTGEQEALSVFEGHVSCFSINVPKEINIKQSLEIGLKSDKCCP